MSVGRRGPARAARPSADVSFVLFPASQQVLETMARQGLVADLIAAGAVVSESTCGACPGFGHVPATGARSLRAFNRNFPGRSGVKGDQVYLSSTQTACASALRGVITDPRTPGRGARASIFPARFSTVRRRPRRCPAADGRVRARRQGPQHPRGAFGRPPGRRDAPGRSLIKLGDKVSTDDISPVGLPGPRLPVQHAGDRRVHVPERRTPTSWPGPGRPAGASSWRPDLRPGLLARGRRDRADVPRRPRRDGEELRPHPPRQPDQLGRAARSSSPTRPTTTRSRPGDGLRISGVAAGLAAGHADRRGPDGPGRRIADALRADGARARHPAGRRRLAHTRAARPSPRPDASGASRRSSSAAGTSRALVFHHRDLPARPGRAGPHLPGRARQPRP